MIFAAAMDVAQFDELLVECSHASRDAPLPLSRSWRCLWLSLCPCSLVAVVRAVSVLVMGVSTRRPRRGETQDLPPLLSMYLCMACRLSGYSLPCL